MSIYTKPEPQIDTRTPAEIKAASELAKARALPDQMVGDWETKLNQFWANADQAFFDALGTSAGAFFAESAAYAQFLASRFGADRPDIAERIQAASAALPPFEIGEDGRVTLLPVEGEE